MTIKQIIVAIFESVYGYAIAVVIFGLVNLFIIQIVDYRVSYFAFIAAGLGSGIFTLVNYLEWRSVHRCGNINKK